VGGVIGAAAAADNCLVAIQTQAAGEHADNGGLGLLGLQVGDLQQHEAMSLACCAVQKKNVG
jgi:hypothetical protein